MFRIRVERTIGGSIDRVFEMLSDHEGYTRFPGVTEACLLEEGRHEKNGEGALRKLSGEKGFFIERITRFERPARMDYLVTSSKPIELRHDRGEITLEQQGNETRVTWISEGHAKVPILGTVFFDRVIQRQGSAAFGAMLDHINDSMQDVNVEH